MASILYQKSFQFSVRIVRLCRYLESGHREFVLSKQLLRAGTSIGANIAEAQQAQSRPDFVAKMSIALKETAETIYWIKLLRETDYLTESGFRSILQDATEIEKMLTGTLKTCKRIPG